MESDTATGSSIVAWKIPWTEEPGRLHTVHGVAKESDMTECTHACMVTREKLGFVIKPCAEPGCPLHIPGTLYICKIA